MKTLKTIAIIFSLAAIFTSCSNDDDSSPVNEEEVISTVKVTLTNGANIITLTSKDLDLDGPNLPEITVSGNLSANTTYTGEVSLLNETVSPVKVVSEEIVESAQEKLDHQFFYVANSGLLGAFTYEDEDGNGNPIGLRFTFTTGAASTGDLSVILKHLPNKSAEGVSSGDITNAGGNTDAEAKFNITVN